MYKINFEDLKQGQRFTHRGEAFIRTQAITFSQNQHPQCNPHAHLSQFPGAVAPVQPIVVMINCVCTTGADAGLFFTLSNETEVEVPEHGRKIHQYCATYTDESTEIISQASQHIAEIMAENIGRVNGLDVVRVEILPHDYAEVAVDE